ncbi:MAG TPA: hypothetical protein VKZ66_01760 [Pusillimonas sp.]|uniref:hypothetical protein n=1 Tax=Pusillimonas sp. TaxID=3040095 RepID=UPI002B4AB599|nr:hypothetical protein [Pusillimonas sp.]HLU18659.1 hypothetical protein [Pusillimonas sp.]
MHIVLPGALPGPDAARALLSHLEKTAPTFVGWLAAGSARTQSVDPAKSGCTAIEQWQLEKAGFTPDANQNLSAGLGPLWSENHEIDPQEPVWLAELVHMAPTQSSAALLTSDDLNITREQSVALFDSAHSLFEGTGFQLHPDGVARWRVIPPPGFTFNSSSPSLVSTASVNDWWPQDASIRPWRRLFNEIQMLWFDSPVNVSRHRQGERPINGLWLFGGARPSQLRMSPTTDDTLSHDALLGPFLAQDWGAWLATLSQLETQVFKPMARHGQAPVLVLTGRNSIVTLTPRPFARLSKWMGRGRNSWSKWWLSQN